MADARFRDESLGDRAENLREATPYVAPPKMAAPALTSRLGRALSVAGASGPDISVFDRSAGADDMWSLPDGRRAAQWARWGVHDYVNSTSQPFDPDLTPPASSRGADTPKRM